MGEHIEQQELGVKVAFEDSVEVELEVSGARESSGVAQQAKFGTVGEDAPEVGILAIEEFLQHCLRSARRSCDARVTSVKARAGSEKMDRYVLPLVADGVARAIECQAARKGRDVAVPELAQQGQQPPITSCTRARVLHVMPGRPGTTKVGPCSCCRITDRLVAGESIRRGRDALRLDFTGLDTRQK